jgi:hypothetical protein
MQEYFIVNVICLIIANFDYAIIIIKFVVAIIINVTVVIIIIDSDYIGVFGVNFIGKFVSFLCFFSKGLLELCFLCYIFGNCIYFKIAFVA